MEKKQIFMFCRPSVFGLLAALIVCTALHTAPAVQAYADEEDCVSYEGTNIGTQDYYAESFKGLRESDNSGS